MTVRLGISGEVTVQLIAVWVSEQAVQRQWEHWKEYARKKKVPFDAEEARLWSRWWVVWTNLPSQSWPLPRLGPLLRLRWQVEILFRAWKSTLGLKRSRNQAPYPATRRSLS